MFKCQLYLVSHEVKPLLKLCCNKKKKHITIIDCSIHSISLVKKKKKKKQSWVLTTPSVLFLDPKSLYIKKYVRNEISWALTTYFECSEMLFYIVFSNEISVKLA